jgi:hypothetical protein
MKIGQFDAILFNIPPQSPLSTLSPSSLSEIPLDIAYTIDMNEWNGKKNLQLKIKDLSHK